MKYIIYGIVLVFLCSTYPLTAQVDGRLDSTFGNAGKYSISIPAAPDLTDFFVQKSSVQTDGKMLVMVSKSYQTGSVFSDTAFLCRLMPSGQLDPGFGQNGFQKIGMTSRNFLVLPSGQFLVIGNDEDSEIMIEKYLESGAPDVSYGNNGRVYTGLFMYANVVAMQPNGKVLIAGSSGNSNVLAGFNVDGSRDLTLGKDGFTTIKFDEANLFENVSALLVQPDGKIVVGGQCYTNQYKAALLRLQNNGERDSTFGVNGARSYPVATYWMNALLLQQDAKIVFGCANTVSSGIILYRVKPNGNPDSTFGVNGLRGTNFAAGTNSLSRLLLQPDGRIICVGAVNADFAMMRVTGAGVVDNTFNGTGKTITSFGSNFSSNAQEAMVMQDGKILVLGSSRGNSPANDTVFQLSMARYTSGIRVGILEPTQVSEVLIYPNPVQDELSVRYTLPSATLVSIVVYDLQGRVVEQVSKNQLQYAGEHDEKIMMNTDVKGGLYILELTAGAAKKSIKIMKM